MSPVKIEDCWVMSREAKVRPMIMPRYLPLSPMSILRAMEYTLDLLLILITLQEVPRFVTPAKAGVQEIA